MAYFDLAENPNGDGYACSTCHAGEYSLKNEALHKGGEFSAHTALPDSATYDDCLTCHASGGEGDDTDALATDATDLRPVLHWAHMNSTNSHAPKTCFTCHEVEGYGPDSPSGQFFGE